MGIFFLIFFFLISSLIPHHPALLFAQTPLEKVKNDYSVQIKKYNQAKEDYITAKSNYAAFNTAASKADAFLKTKEYLVQTNFLIANYLLVIKESSNQISWENLIYNKDTALKPIDEEINYLQENWRQIEKTSKLEDLPPIATQLSAHLENSTKPITNKVLTTYEVIKSEQAINRFNQISQKLKSFIEPRISEGNRSIVNNWQSEIDRIKKETEANMALAKLDFETFVVDRPNDYQKEKVLQSTKLISQELSKSKTLFNEILRII